MNDKMARFFQYGGILPFNDEKLLAPVRNAKNATQAGGKKGVRNSVKKECLRCLCVYVR